MRKPPTPNIQKALRTMMSAVPGVALPVDDTRPTLHTAPFRGLMSAVPGVVLPSTNKTPILDPNYRSPVGVMEEAGLRPPTPQDEITSQDSSSINPITAPSDRFQAMLQRVRSERAEELRNRQMAMLEADVQRTAEQYQSRVSELDAIENGLNQRTDTSMGQAIGGVLGLFRGDNQVPQLYAQANAQTDAKNRADGLAQYKRIAELADMAAKGNLEAEQALRQFSKAMIEQDYLNERQAEDIAFDDYKLNKDQEFKSSENAKQREFDRAKAIFDVKTKGALRVQDHELDLELADARLKGDTVKELKILRAKQEIWKAQQDIGFGNSTKLDDHRTANDKSLIDYRKSVGGGGADGDGGDDQYIPQLQGEKPMAIFEPAVKAQRLAALSKSAHSMIGTKYVWGGNDRKSGLDCSSFTQTVMSDVGVTIPRTAADQFKKLPKVKDGDLQPGDLVYFRLDTKQPSRISHTGIYIGNGKIIHASSTKGKVMQDEFSRFTRSYAGARRP